MAILFLDSCADYTDPNQKYDITFFSRVTTGRENKGTLGGTMKMLPSSIITPSTGTLFVGMAFQRGFNYNSWGDIIECVDFQLTTGLTGNSQCKLQYGPLGFMRFANGTGTVLATTANPVFIDTNWHYIECSFKVGTTDGAMTARVDGVEVLSVSGVNTQFTVNASWNGFGLGSSNQSGGSGGSGPMAVCDIYALDDTGPAPYNTFLGDQKMYYTPLAGNASPNQFTPQAASRANSTAYALNAIVIDSNGNLQLATTAGTAGTAEPTWNASIGGTTTDGSVTWTNKGTPANWKYVSNVPSNDTQAYLSDGTVGDEELYSITPFGDPSDPVTAVCLTMRARKDQTYACAIRGLCSKGGVTVDNGADLALTETSSDVFAALNTDPSTGVAWANVGAVNAATVGVKVTAA